MEDKLLRPRTLNRPYARPTPPAKPRIPSQNTSSEVPMSPANIHDATTKLTVPVTQSHALSLGNYPSYYQRRNRLTPRSVLDPRLSLMPASLFERKRVLDIGCNAGTVAIALAIFARPRHIEAIDIDPALIEEAIKKSAFHASRIHPSTAEVDYFPLTAPLTLTPIPTIRKTDDDDDTANEFPANISFRLSNFLLDPLPIHSSEADKFDTVLALSITKWIHVRHGDAGLKLFFRKCYAALKRGGVLVLEPQPWSGNGYEKAARKTHKPSSNAETGDSSNKEKTQTKARLELRPDEFPTFLMDQVGFRSCEKLGDSSNPSKG
ncbi:hypothetical protein HDU81_003355, partial [Chytriomyces hyalinus]